MPGSSNSLPVAPGSSDEGPTAGLHCLVSSVSLVGCVADCICCGGGSVLVVVVGADWEAVAS